MARDFPEALALTIPLRTTWEERWVILDVAGDPVPLTGYEFRMQVRDKHTGAVVLEIDSTGANPRAVIDDPNGAIAIRVSAQDVSDVSPENRKTACKFDCEIYIPAGANPEYVIPLLKGSASFQPRVTQL